MLKPISLFREDYVFKENQLGQEMYILEEGKVVLSRYGVSLAALGKGSFFGQIFIFSLLLLPDRLPRRLLTFVFHLRQEHKFI